MFYKNLNLTDMCLEVIATNLEVIVTNEKIPQKSVYFLLRLYGRKLFHGYELINKTMSEDVMLWFLNPHVREITLHRELFSEKIVEKLQSIGMGITALNLHRSSAPENALNAIIRCVPCVKILDLSHTSCTDTTLSVIQESCAGLENLYLRYCKNITDDGLENLCGENKSLKILDLTCSGVEGYGAVIILNRMPSLECIKFNGFTKILIEEMDPHQEYNITELACELKGNDSETIQTLVKMCPKIKKLHIDFTFPVEENVIGACTVFRELKELKFNHTNQCLIPLLPISLNLETLILTHVSIPTVLLFENFKNLKKLYLVNVGFYSFQKEDIKCTENKLNTLVINNILSYGSPIFHSATYEAISLLLSVSKNVTRLDLAKNSSIPSHLFDVILNSMKHLSYLSVYRSVVKLSSLIPFFDSRIPSLKMIYANYVYDDEIEDYVTRTRKLSKSSSSLKWRFTKYDYSELYQDEFPRGAENVFNPNISPNPYENIPRILYVML